MSISRVPPEKQKIILTLAIQPQHYLVLLITFRRHETTFNHKTQQ